jgi:hypothetical protein
VGGVELRVGWGLLELGRVGVRCSRVTSTGNLIFYMYFICIKFAWRRGNKCRGGQCVNDKPELTTEKRN